MASSTTEQANQGLGEMYKEGGKVAQHAAGYTAGSWQLAEAAGQSCNACMITKGGYVRLRECLPKLEN